MNRDNLPVLGQLPPEGPESWAPGPRAGHGHSAVPRSTRACRVTRAEQCGVATQLHEWTLKLEFLLIFVGHEMSFGFFHLFRNVRSVLGLGAGVRRALN